MNGKALSRRIGKITFPERDAFGAWIHRGLRGLSARDCADLKRLRSLVVDGAGLVGLNDQDFDRLEALIAMIDATPDPPPNIRLRVSRDGRTPPPGGAGTPTT